MKKKDLKNLAKRLAKLEKKLSSTTDASETKKIQNEIIELSGQIQNVEEIFILDDMIQEILDKS